MTHTGMSEGAEAGPVEVELKLQVPPAEVERLREHPRVLALSQGEASTRTLRSIYFDTPDLQLARDGIALRVRQTGDGLVQTVKTRSSGTAGLFGRTEIECEVPTERPDIGRVSDPRLRQRLATTAAAAEFGAIVETEFQRSSRRLILNGTEFLFELDVGEVRTRSGNAPICELELELVRGDPTDLYDLALEIQDSIPVRPVTISKADLGFALITGEQPVPRRAGRLETPAGACLEDVWRAVLGASIEHLIANETPAREAIDLEGVHQLRVAARRLRSALSVFSPVLPKEQVAFLRGELRWLGSETGDARDLDVFIDETLDPITRRASEAADLKRMREEALALREQAQTRVRDALDSDRFARLVLSLGRWLVARGWREGLGTEATARLDASARNETAPLIGRRHRKVVEQGREIADLDAEARHRLRIRLKKLRYGAELLGCSHPERAADARRYAKRLARLQDTLGHLNDVATADRLLAEILKRMGDGARSEDVRAVAFVAGCVNERSALDDGALVRSGEAFANLTPFWGDLAVPEGSSVGAGPALRRDEPNG